MEQVMFVEIAERLMVFSNGDFPDGAYEGSFTHNLLREKFVIVFHVQY